MHIPILRNKHLPLTVILWLLVSTSMVQAQNEPQAVILQYHHVSTTMPPATSLSPGDFRSHMEYLRDHDFTVLPLQEVIAALQNGSPLPERSAVITFDDGYVSVYSEAFPLLKELEFPFTVFVTAGLVNSNPALYANWEQLREMGAGGATLANHTVTHPYLLERVAGADDAQWLAAVRHEIEAAEQVILDETGQSHKLLAYPYGEYNPQIQSLVRELGYIGIGQHSGPINSSSDFTALPRFPFSGIYASMATFSVKVDSLAFKVRVTSPVSPITDSASPSAELDFDGDYRLEALGCFNNNVPMQIEVLDAGEQKIRIETSVSNNSRRFRYNCTAPGRDGRFYWYSLPWINPALAE